MPPPSPTASCSCGPEARLPRHAPAESSPQSADAPATEITSGTLEVRASHTEVSEALLFNPGKVFGLGAVLGAGEEVINPTVSEEFGVVAAERERLTLAIPRLTTFGPISDHSTVSRIATVAETGLTHVEGLGPGGRTLFRMVIGLTPIASARTTMRWRAELVVDAPPAYRTAARLVAARLRLGFGIAAKVERAADSMEKVVDPAVDRLRELRS